MDCRPRAFVIGLLIAGANVGIAYASEILVGSGEFPPYTTEKTADRGCVISIVKSAYEVEGWTIDVEFMPWPRTQTMLSRGKIDASAYAYSRPDKREEFIFPENPVASEVYKFVFPADAIIEWDTYEDFRDKTIIINSSYTYNEEFYKALDEYYIERIDVASELQNLRMLTKHRADLTIVNQKVFDKYMSELSAEERSELYIDPKPALTVLGYLIFSRSDSEKSLKLAEIFDNGYRKIRDREDLREFFETCGFER